MPSQSRMLSPVRCYSASDAVHSVTRHHAELQRRRREPRLGTVEDADDFG